jgi:hypothetical protein
MKNNRVHLHWTSENQSGTCPTCGGNTALIVCCDCWDVDEESSHAEELADGVETGVEVSGHWCPTCQTMTSMAVNS